MRAACKEQRLPQGAHKIAAVGAAASTKPASRVRFLWGSYCSTFVSSQRLPTLTLDAVSDQCH
jgi:hypothetical protein